MHQPKAREAFKPPASGQRRAGRAEEHRVLQLLLQSGVWKTPGGAIDCYLILVKSNFLQRLTLEVLLPKDLQ